MTANRDILGRKPIRLSELEVKVTPIAHKEGVERLRREQELKRQQEIERISDMGRDR